VVVFWDVVPCSLVDTDISEDLTASIIRVMNREVWYGCLHWNVFPEFNFSLYPSTTDTYVGLYNANIGS
jgi:hypothetical protein